MDEWMAVLPKLFLCLTGIKAAINDRPATKYLWMTPIDSTSLFLLFLSARLRKTLPGGDTTLMAERARLT